MTTEDPTNQANQDPAATDPTVDPTNRVINPDQGGTNFEGFATKDGEIIEQDGNPLNTSTVKPAAKAAAKPAVNKEADAAKRDPQKRIDQAVAKQRAAERRADLAEAAANSKVSALEARLARLESGGQRTNGVDNSAGANNLDAGAPDPKRYEYGEVDAKFIRDSARYETKKEIEAERQRSQSTAQRDQQAAAAREKVATIDAWADKAPVDKYEDFQELVIEGGRNNEWPLSETLGALLLDSPVGYDIAYALASDPKEAVRISKLSAARQAAWFGTEEARLTDEAGAQARNGTGGNSRAANPVRISQAPAVPKHQAKGGGNAEPPSASTTSFADFEKLAMQKQ